MGAETFEFKSEAKQLLDLMIHSLYSNKEIFLRELVSNASDALDKLRFEALTDASLIPEGTKLGVRVHATQEPRTLVISDTGVGMSREEAIANLGTIARSGTKEFAQRIAEAKTEGDGSPDALIGQFGVGFYSSFMAATQVEVVTRRAGEAEATRWISTGDGTYSVEAAERDAPGTTITLTLRDADPDNGLPDFTQEWTIRRTIKKYSDFVTYPIELQTTRTEVEDDDELDDDDDAAADAAEPKAEKTITEWITVNSMKAIWTRSQGDVTDEEYAEFYKHIGHDWEPPFETVRFSAEGTFNYDALLFVPSRAPFDMFYRETKFGLQLYVNRVLVMERCEELLPDWLRFVKGVVDSPDLSLNVSREILQQDRRLGSIKKRIVKKVLEALEKIQSGDRDRYLKFWDSFGRVLKEGTTDGANGEKLHSLLMFKSSADPEAWVSLAEYVARMKDGQDAIYYITGPSREAVEASPHLEAFADKEYEVLYLVDPIDEIMAGHLTKFGELELKSVGKGTVELGTEDEKKEAEEARKVKEEAHASLLEALKKPLAEHVKEVRLSSRLKRSAACLVGDEGDLSPGLEAMLKQANQLNMKTKRILELNPDHPVMAKLQKLYDENAEDPKVADYAALLHGQALIAEGHMPPDPVKFTNLVADLMTR